MFVAACSVVGGGGAGFGAVAADDDERVEVEGGAFAAVDGVVAIGVEGVAEAVGVLAVGG